MKKTGSVLTSRLEPLPFVDHNIIYFSTILTYELFVIYIYIIIITVCEYWEGTSACIS